MDARAVNGVNEVRVMIRDILRYQISSVFWSPPNRGLADVTSPVLAPDPSMITVIVKDGIRYGYEG